jgi:hypothetical protein
LNGKADLETAKHFIAQYAPKGKTSMGVSKIEKIWLKYKDAAPYIYAFYPIVSRALKRDTKYPENILLFLQALSGNEARLHKLIGRAAYASDVLHGIARNVRTRDFTGIPRSASFA